MLFIVVYIALYSTNKQINGKLAASLKFTSCRHNNESATMIGDHLLAQMIPFGTTQLSQAKHNNEIKSHWYIFAK